MGKKKQEPDDKCVCEKAAVDKDKQIEELKDQLLRLAAEFDNYKKRVAKDFETIREYGNQELLCKLLPIMDSFDASLQHTEKKEEFVNGMKMIHSELNRVLEKEGVKQMNCTNQQFDPYKHEVLLSTPSEQDEVVLEELQKGYMYKDRVLRHSKVKIGKHDRKENAKGNDTKTGQGM